MFWCVVLGTWIINLTIVSIIVGLLVKRDRELGYMVASGLYIAWVLAAQIMATKLAIIELPLVGALILPAGTIMFPFAFQATDMINESYGLKKTWYAILTALITQIALTLFFWQAIALPPAPFWKLQEPYSQILGQSARIIIASWIAFIISESLDAWTFSKLKKKFPQSWWVRSIFSDLPNLAVDSLVFISLAFIGVVPFEAIPTMLFAQVVAKWLFGTLDTPWFWLYRKIVYG